MVCFDIVYFSLLSKNSTVKCWYAPWQSHQSCPVDSVACCIPLRMSNACNTKNSESFIYFPCISSFFCRYYFLISEFLPNVNGTLVVSRLLMLDWLSILLTDFFGSQNKNLKLFFRNFQIQDDNQDLEKCKIYSTDSIWLKLDALRTWNPGMVLL